MKNNKGCIFVFLYIILSYILHGIYLIYLWNHEEYIVPYKRIYKSHDTMIELIYYWLFSPITSIISLVHETLCGIYYLISSFADFLIRII